MTTTANGIPGNHCASDPVKSIEPVDMMTEEKVEMAEVPAGQTEAESEKAAESETAKAETTPEEAAKDQKKAVSKPSRFRQLFSRDKSGERKEQEPQAQKESADAAVDSVGTEEKKVEDVAEKVVKSPRRWFIRKHKDPKENGLEPKVDEPQMTIGLNLLDRDERNLNEHVKLSFEDVFAEPDGYHSFDCAWRLAYRVFTATRSFSYRLLALILAVPCAIIWGILFALITVLNIWACVPCARFLTIPATWAAKAWNFFVRSILDPCFRSCGLCLSNVTVRRYSVIPDSPPEHLTHTA